MGVRRENIEEEVIVGEGWRCGFGSMSFAAMASTHQRAREGRREEGKWGKRTEKSMGLEAFITTFSRLIATTTITKSCCVYTTPYLRRTFGYFGGLGQMAIHIIVLIYGVERGGKVKKEADILWLATYLFDILIGFLAGKTILY